MNIQAIAQREQRVFQEALVSYIEEHPDVFITDGHELKDFSEGEHLEEAGLQRVKDNLSEEEYQHLIKYELEEFLLDELYSLTNFHSQPFQQIESSLCESINESKAYNQDPLRYHGIHPSDFVMD